MGNITIYTKNDCVQCKMTKRFLKEHNINFEEKNINSDPDAISYLKSLGYKSVPVVFPKDQNPIVGFRPDQLRGLVG